eukprot:7339936-Pyramimonas_sp.AAC.1
MAAYHYAGRGARSHRPAPAVVEEHVAAYDLYLSVLVGACKILGSWPKSEELWGELQKLPPVWDGQRYRCLSCLRIVSPKS